MFLMTDGDLRVDDSGAGGALTGPAAARFTLANEFLGYLADRRYSPPTVRGSAFDLLAFFPRRPAEDTQLPDVKGAALLRDPYALPPASLRRPPAATTVT